MSTTLVPRQLLDSVVAHFRPQRVIVFGSVARGDNTPDSDLDIMIDVEPEARITVFDYVGLKEYIAGLFDGRVDVVSRDGLKPHVRPAATANAIYAF